MWIKGIMIGIAIGGGMVLPGISGGVLAVLFGIYEKMIKSLLYFFRDWKKNFMFLWPIVVGVGIGAIIFGKILLIFFDKWPVETCYTFIGLILGGTPILFHKIRNKDNGEVNWPVLLAAFILSLTLFVLGRGTWDINFSNNLNNDFVEYILLFITGVVFISGKIIPGISASFMLMLIGMYEYTLNILAHPLSITRSQFIELIPLGLGIVLGGFILLKIINRLIDNYHDTTYSAIIGFIIGSIAAIYPGFSFSIQGLISIILLIGGLVVSYHFAQRNKEEKIYSIK
ncbi:MAG: DUF368 domain-containing protein [Bacilli bacterium]